MKLNLEFGKVTRVVKKRRSPIWWQKAPGKPAQVASLRHLPDSVFVCKTSGALLLDTKLRTVADSLAEVELVISIANCAFNQGALIACKENDMDLGHGCYVTK